MKNKQLIAMKDIPTAIDKMVGISRSAVTIRRHVASGLIPSVKIAGRRFSTKNQIQDYLDGRTAS